jgi:hypothetical protein
MVSTDSDRANYLSLALDARKTIKELTRFSESDAETPGPELREALNDAAESLRALASGGSLFDRLRSSYEYYEQIRTLEEVQSSMKDEHLADRLSALNTSTNPREREKNIEFAMAFFMALENRALQRYNGSVFSTLAR